MKMSLSTGLFLLFLALKLTGYIDWSWIWVTAPLWIGLAIGLAVMAFMFAFAAIIALIGVIYGR
jgi:hypothetical protein